jgi:hypothetical protein
MNRRENLGLMLTTVAANLLSSAGRAAERALVIYDSRFPEARAFAAGAAQALDCSHDAAILWHASHLATARGPQIALGITTASDALVMADCARRAGLKFKPMAHSAAAPTSTLVRWAISRDIQGSAI